MYQKQAVATELGDRCNSATLSLDTNLQRDNDAQTHPAFLGQLCFDNAAARQQRCPLDSTCHNVCSTRSGEWLTLEQVRQGREKGRIVTANVHVFDKVILQEGEHVKGK